MLRESFRGRMRGRVIIVSSAALLLVSCGRETDRGGRTSSFGQSDQALAQVNRAELREEELDRLIPAELREGVSGAEINSILQRWVKTELLYQQARDAGLDRDPEVAERLYELQRQLLADELLQRELQQRVVVSNDEIRAYYDANIEKYTQELHLRHIVLNSEEEAAEIKSQLDAGSAFKTLARKHSIDATSSKGGDLGFLGKGAMNPAFEAIAFDMRPNEVRGPIASSFGFHILQLVGRRKAARPVSFEAARDEILQELLLEKQQEAQRALMAELHAAAEVYVADSYAGMPLETEDTSPEVIEEITDMDAVAAPDSGDAETPDSE